MDTNQWLADIWSRHRGKLVGALAGMLFALIVMSVGILWTLFITVCVAAGTFLGRRIDDGDRGLFERFIPRDDDN